MESEYSQDYQSGCPSKLACSSVQGLSIPLSTWGERYCPPPHREVNQDPIFFFWAGGNGCESCWSYIYHSRLCYGRLCYCALPQYAWYFSTWGDSCRGSLSFAHQLLFKKVVLKISGTINNFRLKNGWDYQKGLCVLVLLSEQFFRVWSDYGRQYQNG